MHANNKETYRNKILEFSELLRIMGRGSFRGIGGYFICVFSLNLELQIFNVGVELSVVCFVNLGQR